MRSFRIPRGLAALLLSALVFAPAAWTQSAVASKGQPLATIRSVRAVPRSDGSTVEIISNRPLVPAISKLDDPPRLIIDLPNARLSDSKRRIEFRSGEIIDVRIGQFQDSVARVVVDLAGRVNYTWDAARNHLTVHLHASQEAANTSSVSSPGPAGRASAIPLSSPSSGGVVLAGSRLSAGSSVTAGSDAAVLRLGRGGEVRVCPGTTVSVTPSQNGRSLMLGMSTGALEAHYTLAASSDLILTPDFRILLAGPGEFHYGLSADARGNTCVQALPGNNASVIVSEVLGDGTYQVKPAQQVVFHSGQLKTADSTVPGSCGCPAPVMPIMRTSNPAAVPDSKASSSAEVARNVEHLPLSSKASSASTPETAALPPSKPNDVHVQVDVPFVFRADDVPSASPAANGQPSAPPAPTQEAKLLPVRELARPAWLQLTALPPARPKAAHHGFFARLKGFFSAVFS